MDMQGSLVHSDVYQMAQGVRKTDTFLGKTTEDVMKKIGLFYGPTARFKMEEEMIRVKPASSCKLMTLCEGTVWDRSCRRTAVPQ